MPDESPPPDEAPAPLTPFPLELFSAEQLGHFLELAFDDPGLVRLARELQVYSPGYRLEAMPPQDVAQLLADEALTSKDVRTELSMKLSEQLLGAPPFAELPFDALDLGDLGVLVTGEPFHSLAQTIWRGLADEDEKLRKAALALLEDGVALLDKSAAPKKTEKKPAPTAEERDAKKAIERAERAEKEREAVKALLVQTRGESAHKDHRLAEARTELRAAEERLAHARAEVARLTTEGADGRRALADERRAEAQARASAHKAEELTVEVADLKMQLALARKEARSTKIASDGKGDPGGGASPALLGGGGGEIPFSDEAESSDFLVPHFTREFYDSIERWDRRLQRAAFDKALMLARDWRHPSLRAIALEGAEGYYRIRVATDVRLIYRRIGNTVEILSLIDREDLDRYVKQAKSR